MRKFAVPLMLAASISLGSTALAQEKKQGFLTILHGETTFSMRGTFSRSGTFFVENDVSKRMSENSLNVFLDFDNFLDDLLQPYMLNLDSLPETTEARELVVRLYTREYFARLFPEGSRQYEIAKSVLDKKFDNGSLQELLNLVVQHPFVSEQHGTKNTLSAFQDDLDDLDIDAVLTPQQREALGNILPDYYEELYASSVNLEIILGLLGNEGLPFAREQAQIQEQIYKEVWKRLEAAGVGFVLPSETLQL